jgi:hypothetical protein
MDALQKVAKGDWAPIGTTISPSSTKHSLLSNSARRTTSGKCCCRSWPLLKVSATSSAWRARIHRKPSRLGSHCHRVPPDPSTERAPLLQWHRSASCCLSLSASHPRLFCSLCGLGLSAAETLLQGIHEIDDIAFFNHFFRRLDRLAGRFPLHQSL